MMLSLLLYCILVSSSLYVATGRPSVSTSVPPDSTTIKFDIHTRTKVTHPIFPVYSATDA